MIEILKGILAFAAFVGFLLLMAGAIAEHDRRRRGI